MMYFALLLLILTGVACGYIVGLVSMRNAMDSDTKRLWQHIQDLEADKRALTESLCRAQGVPYVPSQEKREFKPSDGWFDGAVIVKLPEA